MLIHRVCAALEKVKVHYAVVGGYAVALHGAIRGTVDVNIVIHWTKDELKRAESALKNIGLVSLQPLDADAVFNFREEYIHNRNMIAWNFYDPAKPTNQVDLIINYDLKNAHSKLIKTSEGTVRVLSLHDLIEMKKASGRPQDLQDVKALENL